MTMDVLLNAGKPNTFSQPAFAIQVNVRMAITSRFLTTTIFYCLFMGFFTNLSPVYYAKNHFSPKLFALDSGPLQLFYQAFW